ncbi:MAG: methyltransferase [Deltaproteobacteria bacterium]|nr:methyltransferase [Deltaproteobacteria bacterium]
MGDQSSQPPDPTSWLRMNQLVLGFAASQAIAVAAKLGIADLVAEAPKTLEELAGATKAHAPSLRRLLLMLASIGIFAEDSNGRFRNTPLSETLRSDNPQSMQNYAVLNGEPWVWRPWGDLYHTVLTGEPAFDHMYGSSHFEYLAQHPDDAAVFDAAMSSFAQIIPEILAAYDFSQFEQVVDVGGGQGTLLHGILSVNPKLRGVLADLPTVVAGAAALQKGPFANRCEIVGMDFFKAVPEGADAYVMKAVIHDWDNEPAVKILKNCRRAIRNDGKLLLMEHVLKPSNEPDPGRFMDLMMLVLLTGRERTETEFATLLRAAGFSLTRVIPTSGLLSIIESQPA